MIFKKYIYKWRIKKLILICLLFLSINQLNIAQSADDLIKEINSLLIDNPVTSPNFKAYCKISRLDDKLIIEEFDNEDNCWLKYEVYFVDLLKYVIEPDFGTIRFYCEKPMRCVKIYSLGRLKLPYNYPNRPKSIYSQHMKAEYGEYCKVDFNPDSKLAKQLVTLFEKLILKFHN